MYFDSHLRDSSCLRTNLIRHIYQGAQSEAELVNPTVRRLPRIPLGLETLHSIRPNPGDPPNPHDPTGMIFLALRLSAHYGARQSEYAFDSQRDAHHTLLARGVSFIIAGRSYPSYTLSGSDISPDLCSHIHVRWPSTKIDPKTGDLRRTSPSQAALIDDLLRWSIGSLTLESDPFFSIRHGDALRILNPSSVSSFLKALGVSQGLNPKAISSHCGRRGSATQRTAFGQDKATIHQAIGWSQKGDTSLAYTDHIPTLDPSGRITFHDLRQSQRPLTSSSSSSSSTALPSPPQPLLHLTIPSVTSSSSSLRGTPLPSTTGGSSESLPHAPPSLVSSRTHTLTATSSQPLLPSVAPPPSISGTPTLPLLLLGGGRTRNLLPVRSSSDHPSFPSQQR